MEHLGQRGQFLLAQFLILSYHYCGFCQNLRRGVKVNYKKLLLERKARIGVWGIGYIGYSTLVAYAREGVAGVGFDVSKKRVSTVNNGSIDIPGMAEWLGFPVKSLVKQKLIMATSNLSDMLTRDVVAHFVCVPTEDLEKPTDKFLLQVFAQLARLPVEGLKPIIVVESTLTPGTTEKVLIPFLEKKGKRLGWDVYLAVAPRRDWFVEKTKTLKVLDRIFGATDKKASKIAREVLSIVCDKLHAAPSHKEAEIAKSVENAYRQMDISLANQLTLAYPDVDIREVLRLAGTKWNMNTYHPGFGTGGYCIPLAPKYVLAGARRPAYLTLLVEAMKTEKMMPRAIVNSLVKKKIESVCILGLSYKGGLKVPTLSPTIELVKFLQRENIKVRVCDPLYSDKEIEKITGTGSFAFPQELDDFDAILLEADHHEFRVGSIKDYLEKLKKVRLVLDNTGMWQNYGWKNTIKYFVAGDKDWLNGNES